MPCYDNPAYSNSFDVFIRGKQAVILFTINGEISLVTKKDIIINIKKYYCLFRRGWFFQFWNTFVPNLTKRKSGITCMSNFFSIFYVGSWDTFCADNELKRMFRLEEPFHASFYEFVLVSLFMVLNCSLDQEAHLDIYYYC